MAITVKAYLQQASDRIDALELRERLLLLVATIIMLYLAIDSMGMQPAFKAQQVVEQQVSGVEMKLSALRNQANLLNYNNGDDLLQMRSDTRDKLTSDLTTLNENIRGQLGALVEPAQAAELLEQVVAEHRGLKIKSLHASTAPLDDIHLGGSQASGLNQYQLDLELEGGYLDLLRYLQALESMPWKFFWQNVDFRISLHPHAVTRLQVYTLGAAENG